MPQEYVAAGGRRGAVLSCAMEYQMMYTSRVNGRETFLAILCPCHNPHTPRQFVSANVSLELASNIIFLCQKEVEKDLQVFMTSIR